MSLTQSARAVTATIARRFPLFAALVAGGLYPAHAQETADISGSIITLSQPLDGDAVAQIDMMNQPTNGLKDNGGFTLSIPGLTVGVEFIWQQNQAGHDAIRVLPPEGIFCVPMDCTLIVPESDSGSMQLFAAEGLGA